MTKDVMTMAMDLIDEIVQEQFLCNGSSKEYTMEIMNKIQALREAIKEQENTNNKRKE